ncbi:hypothetical protein JCM10914A_56010 [Paenibacillus sp. JCM 10914]|uniref:hypothetical protein n=1 Tax=Paenibacillus sp. JCM 10914 TaxID=1236974 RepID=UPI0003CC81BA|nr:hypothetical protein [Paenibacillus sp. JCM 10914]GAE09600.1 hypothetical protein JCM10914_5968 [Paenibacillus sp. JCM 10914]
MNNQDASKEEVHYQLYKLLAYAIQELSYFASDERMQEALDLPRPLSTITNRAQMAVNRLHDQNPHFFSGYIKYNRKEVTHE